MSDKLILTIDFGTQSVRVSLFNKKGDIVDMSKHTYEQPYFSTNPGYAEQDPNYYFEALKMTAKELTERNKDKLDKIAGVTLTCFRDTAVLLDKDMKVVRPSILWLDQRLAKCKKRLPLINRIIFKIVGMSETVLLNRKRSMANWFQENEPETFDKTVHYGGVSTYINYLLTGEFVDSASNLAGHYPIDFKHRKWYSSDNHMKGQIFGVKLKLLPKIVPEGKVIGKITKEASELTGIPEGIVLYASGSDKSCETLGLGVLDEETASISYGTASTVEITSRKYHDSEPFLPAYPSCVPNYYNMDVQIYRGYWMLNWFTKEFASGKDKQNVELSNLIENMNDKMLDVPVGSDGLVLQPYWGPGLRRPLAKGAIIGFSDFHTREHLYRAIIEGIAYALREGLEGFRGKTHKKVKEIRISGGGSKCDAICQITSDIFGVPVKRVQTFETSSLGAAIAGFLAIGEYSSAEEAVKEMVHITDSFEPNELAHKEYDYLFYKVYLKMYPKMKNLYKDLKLFNRRRRLFFKQ